MSSSEDYNIQLELKERLRYPEYLEDVIKNINSAFNNEKISTSKVNIMILNFLHDIPSSWYDNEFVEDIKGVITEKIVPNVVKWCGISMSKEYMEKHDIPLTKKVNNVNYFKLKNAIINLLDRLNMLVRKDKIEKSTGKNLKYESLDDLIDELQKEDEENEELEI